jgi:DNA processing protein
MTGARNEACRECVRRGWLLSKLSVRLDWCSRDEHRLLELLGLDDEPLIEAIAGRWREDLKGRWERFELDGLDMSGPYGERDNPTAAPDAPDATAGDGRALGAGPGVATVCRHSSEYPRALREGKGAPRMLHVVGGRERLTALTAAPAVAIVGSERPTDYGMEMAGSLARGLAASGVTIVSGYANGIAAAAHAGALEAQGPTVTVMAGGVDVVQPAARRELYERIVTHGCAIAEPPCGYPQRRWCTPARARTIAGLARLTIVVEADERPRELLVARVAQALGRAVAAMPGRVTSPVSRGTNALLMAGAPLVRGPADALDVLYGVGTTPPPATSLLGAPSSRVLGSAAIHKSRPSPPRDEPIAREHGRLEPTRLEPRLQAVLEQVGAGADTPGKLTCAGENADETMQALAELELMGLLGRGDGGRYVPRESLASR